MAEGQQGPLQKKSAHEFKKKIVYDGIDPSTALWIGLLGSQKVRQGEPWEVAEIQDNTTRGNTAFGSSAIG